MAAVNGPESVVISGKREAMHAIAAHLTAAGVESKELRVSHAFHSSSMEPILADFERLVSEVALAPPRIELISNLTGKKAGEEITTAAYWRRHIRQPVQFAASMESLNRRGCKVYLEIGPRPALLGLGRVCLPEDAGIFLPSLHPRRDAWQQMLQSLSELYEAGVSIDWSGVDRDYARQRVALPTYPFQRRRYAIEKPTARWSGPGPGRERLHPLLDSQIQSPLLDRTLFETWFDVHALPLLADHRVYDTVLVSGASHLSLVLGATELMLDQAPFALAEILFRQALVVPEEGCKVQLGIDHEHENGRSFELISAAPDSAVGTTHVTGKILTDRPVEPAAVPDPECIWDRCGQTMTADEFHQIQLDRQIYLGPSYQWVETVSRGNKEAICRIDLPKEVEDAEQYQLPPGLIDACFGLLAVAVELEVTDTFIPFSIEEVRFYQRPRGFKLQAHIQVHPESNAGQVVGDIQLFEESGKIIAEFIGFAGRKADREHLLGRDQTAAHDEFYSVVWQPMALPRADAEETGSWLIFADQEGLGSALARQLQEHGKSAILVRTARSYEKEDSSSYSLNPVHAEDFQRLFEELKDRRPSHIVHLWGLDASAADLPRAQELSCASVLHLVQSLATKRWQSFPALYLLSRRGQAVDSTDLRVEQGPIAGLGRVIGLEFPELHCVCLDLDSPGENDAQILFDELQSPGGGERQVAWRRDDRYVARFQRHRLLPGKTPLPMHEQSSYLITGGTGALGLSLAGWLVEQGARHIVLLSRRGVSSTAAQEAVCELEEAGARLTLVQADVADRAALHGALDEALAAMPPLRGIIHAAGALDDGMLIGQTWAQFKKVMAAKVDGAWNLHHYTTHLELDFFVLFSSVAALFGNQGQGNYASANAFLDALAHYRRHRDLPATTINWGPWKQAAGMVDSHAAEWLTRQGFKPLETVAGLEALARILVSENATQVAVVQCDWHVYLDQAMSPQPFFEYLTAGQKAQEPDLLLSLEQAPPREQRALLLDFVVETARQIIGMHASDPLEVDKPLMEMGMDSLMSVEMRNRLGKGLGASLPVSLLFNYPSVNEVLGYIEREFIKADATTAPEETREEVDAPFAHLDGLSEEELEDLINRDLTGE